MLYLLTETSCKVELNEWRPETVKLLGIYTQKEPAQTRLKYLKGYLDNNGYRTDKEIKTKSSYQIIPVDPDTEINLLLGGY